MSPRNGVVVGGARGEAAASTSRSRNGGKIKALLKNDPVTPLWYQLPRHIPERDPQPRANHDPRHGTSRTAERMLGPAEKGGHSTVLGTKRRLILRRKQGLPAIHSGRANRGPNERAP